MSMEALVTLTPRSDGRESWILPCTGTVRKVSSVRVSPHYRDSRIRKNHRCATIRICSRISSVPTPAVASRRMSAHAKTNPSAAHTRSPKPPKTQTTTVRIIVSPTPRIHTSYIQFVVVVVVVVAVVADVFFFTLVYLSCKLECANIIRESRKKEKIQIE